MGNQKQKWTAAEEEALLAGVAKHGPGKWKNILKDPDFAPHLTQRSNIDLKDKWRNLSVSTSGQGTKEKSRTPKIKAAAAAGTSPAVVSGTSSTPSSAPNAPNSALAVTLVHDEASPMVVDDLANNAADVKNAPRYNAMVFEALSTIKNDSGLDIGAIINFIEQWHEVPQNFRRLLGSRLRRLVSQGKLEKVENRYKICNDVTSAAKTTPTLKQHKDTCKPRLATITPAVSTLGETQEEAAMAAAYKVAEAENKSFLAAEAVKEAERIAKLAEDSDSMLQIAMDIYELCARGENVPLE